MENVRYSASYREGTLCSEDTKSDTKGDIRARGRSPRHAFGEGLGKKSGGVDENLLFFKNWRHDFVDFIKSKCLMLSDSVGLLTRAIAGAGGGCILW